MCLLVEVDLLGWHWFNSILTIMIGLSRIDWCLVWKSKDANIAAYLFAKFSLANNCILNADEFSFGSLPVEIVNKLSLDQLGGLV